MRVKNSQLTAAIVAASLELEAQSPSELFCYLRDFAKNLYSCHKNAYPEKAKFLHLLVCHAIVTYPAWKKELIGMAVIQYIFYSKKYGKDVTRNWKRVTQK